MLMINKCCVVDECWSKDDYTIGSMHVVTSYRNDLKTMVVNQIETSGPSGQVNIWKLVAWTGPDA